MVDCPLLGNIQGNDRPGPHHDLGGLLLGDPHQTVTIHPQQLISCLKTSILPGSASLNHRLNVNPKTFLSNSFGSHNAQSHPIGLAQSDCLDFWLLWMQNSITIDRTTHVRMGLRWGTSMMWGTSVHWSSPISGPTTIPILIIVSTLHLCSIHGHLAGLAR